MNIFNYLDTAAETAVTLMNETIRRRQYFGSKFTDLIGARFLKRMGREDEVSALAPGQKATLVGAPVETITGFIQEGRTDMLIPILHRLKGDPTYGDKALEGTEEGNVLTTRSVMINRTRKAYAKMTGMSYQSIKMWAKQYVRKGEMQLTQWFNDTFPGKTLLSALHYGYSHDLIVNLTNGGRGVSTISHPNMFVAGSGQVSYAGGRPGTAGYEASVEAAVNGLAGAGAAGEMSVNFVRNLIQEAPSKRIRPIVSKSGYPLYPFFIGRGQWVQLRKDTELKNYWGGLRVAKQEEHPLGNLGECIIDGALIIVDHKLWAAYTNAVNANVVAGTVEYGPRPTAAQLAKGFKVGDTIDQLDEGDYECCFILGESALAVATGEEISFHDNIKDYDNVEGMGIDMIKSAVRVESYDTYGQVSGLTQGDFHENITSLMGVTKSPFALVYA